MPEPAALRIYNGAKRAFDLGVVALAAPIWLPALAIVACLVRLAVGRPVFFRQARPGRDSRSFNLVKFRSMTERRDRDGKLLPDAERLNRFGRWLRGTSLDELPELFNVIKGEMSLVGPRPLLTQYLGRYNETQARRHLVLPGITGLAQVKGRNSLSWERKLALDVEYVESRCFSLDLKILWLTLFAVLRRDGINARGEATMPEFNPPASKK